MDVARVSALVLQSPGLALWFFSALALMVGGRKDMQPIKIPVPVIP